MTGITAEGFEIHREFPASPDAVFAALTSATAFAQWFGGASVAIENLEYVAVEGGTWSATMRLPDGNTIDWVGDFVEVTPNMRFVVTMTDRPAEPKRLAVTFELAPTDSGTALHMTQEAPDFPDAQKAATIAGWQSFLDVLGQVALAA